MKISDIISGSILIVFGTAAALHARTFPHSEMVGFKAFGPGFFPSLIGALLAASGVLLIVRHVVNMRRGRASQHLVELAAWYRSPRRLINVLLVPGALLFYVLASNSLGYILSAFVILFVLIYRYGKRLLSATIIAVVATGVSFWVFNRLLFVPLPAGILKPLLY
jgi:putative tricarboxylic transport membrane protein